MDVSQMLFKYRTSFATPQKMPCRRMRVRFILPKFADNVVKVWAF